MYKSENVFVFLSSLLEQGYTPEEQNKELDNKRREML
jgi:hypothetical protein